MKKLFKNLSLLTLAELIEKMVIFLLFIYMGRVLSVEEFGYLNYILAVASYFIIFIDLGLPQLATRELSSHQDISVSLLKTILTLKFILFVFVASLWFLFVILTQKDHLFIGMTFTLYLFSRVIDIYWYLQGRQQFMQIARLKLMKAAMLLSAFAVLYFYPHIEAYVIVLVCALLLPFFWFIWDDSTMRATVTKIYNIFLIQNPYRMKVLVCKSMPLIVSTFLILMYYNLDTIFIKHYIGLEAVAQYNAAYKIIFAFIVVRSIFTSVIFPRISKDKLNWDEGKVFFLIGSAIAMVIFLFSYAFSEEILSLAYGDKYLTSTSVFIILSMTASVLWINLFFPIFFIAIKKDTVYMKVHIFTALLNLVGNLILIPRYGIEGAASATLMADIASLMIFGLMFYRVKHTHKENS